MHENDRPKMTVKKIMEMYCKKNWEVKVVK